MTVSPRKAANLEPAHSLVRKAGGEDAIAQALGLAEITVYKWQYPKSRGGTGGVIPSTYHQRLMSWSNKNKKGLQPADFFGATG